jgi:thiamine biosynthesis lipoprotein
MAVRTLTTWSTGSAGSTPPFSPFRADSWVSRLQDGRVGALDCPAEVTAVLERCTELSQQTSGWFSITASGSLDPCGFVKGWAVESACRLLRRRGLSSYAINGGGDIRVQRDQRSKPWRIGIADPLDSTLLAATVSGRDFAIATSGVAERGLHVINPMTSRPATGVESVTVVGADLGVADAYATACVAMGRRAPGWIERVDGYEAFGIFSDGQRWRSSGFAAYEAGPPEQARLS